jgi:hypothetical protein
MAETVVVDLGKVRMSPKKASHKMTTTRKLMTAVVAALLALTTPALAGGPNSLLGGPIGTGGPLPGEGADQAKPVGKWAWTDMPDRTFICDGEARAEYSVVWVHPSERTMTVQFRDQHGPIKTYRLTSFTPYMQPYQQDPRPNWEGMWDQSDGVRILWLDALGPVPAQGWTFVKQGWDGVSHCRIFNDPSVQPGNWVMER